MDTFHVSENLDQAARSMMGDGEVARSWAEEELGKLIRVGGPKYLEHLDKQMAQTSESTHREALGALRTYLHGNRDRMWHARRLQEGKPIGSGAIEGACKKIGTRLKLKQCPLATPAGDAFRRFAVS